MANDNSAWGVEFGGSAIRMVRVVQTESGYEVDRYLHEDLDDRWSGNPDLHQVLRQIRPQDIEGPLGICISDDLTLFHTLSLPDTDPSAMEKMIDAQIELLIPTQEDRFVWKWDSAPGASENEMRTVLLCAMRRDALSRGTNLCKALNCEPNVVLPSAIALGLTCSQLTQQTDRPLALLDVAANSTSVIVIHNGQVTQCGVLDHGSDHWTESISEHLNVPPDRAEQMKLRYFAKGQSDSPDLEKCLKDAMHEWSQQLREVYSNCVEGIPHSDRPTRCILLGRGSQSSGLEDLVRSGLQIDVERCSPSTGIALPSGAELGQVAPAIGAGIAALEPERTEISFIVRKPKPPIELRKVLLGWGGILAGLVVSVLLLYGSDKYEANWLESAVAEIRAKTSEKGGLGRELAVARYLENACAGALEVLDEISAIAPAKLIVTQFEYNRNGAAILNGIVPSDKDWGDLLKKLDESRMFRKVEPRQTKMESGKLHFEVRLTVGHEIPQHPTTQPTTKPVGQESPKPTTAPTAESETSKTAETPEPPPPAEPPETDKDEPEKPTAMTPDDKRAKARAEAKKRILEIKARIEAERGGGS